MDNVGGRLACWRETGESLVSLEVDRNEGGGRGDMACGQGVYREVVAAVGK